MENTSGGMRMLSDLQLVYMVSRNSTQLLNINTTKFQVECAGARAACPRNWKAKKKRSNSKLFHLYFATFLVGNIIFSAIFWAELPPWKIEKPKKKPFIFSAPPPYEFLDTPLQYNKNMIIVHGFFTLLLFIQIPNSDEHIVIRIHPSRVH